MNSTKHTDIRAFRPDDTDALAGLFQRAQSERFFQPHPMTRAEALRICSRRTYDVYLGGFMEHEIVSYGLLRGWDNGYNTPSAGVFVAKEHRRMGHGKQMLRALHSIARLRGAGYVRVRVHPDNIATLNLDKALGYEFGGEQERGELVGLLDLRRLPRTRKGPQ